MNNQSLPNFRVIAGGVDTHEDLHVGAVVDAYDRVIASNSFPTTRHGYKSMLNWIQSFGKVKCIGVECTGTYDAGLLRYLQQFDIKILEINSPDKPDRLMQHLLGDAPPQLKRVMAWSDRYGFSSYAGEPPLQLDVSYYK